MGCNCGKNGLLKINERYTEYATNNKENILVKIMNILLQFFFGVFLMFFVLIAVIPFLGYVFMLLITGKNLKFNIFWLSDWLNKKIKKQ